MQWLEDIERRTWERAWTRSPQDLQKPSSGWPKIDLNDVPDSLKEKVQAYQEIGCFLTEQPHREITLEQWKAWLSDIEAWHEQKMDALVYPPSQVVLSQLCAPFVRHESLDWHKIEANPSVLAVLLGYPGFIHELISRYAPTPGIEENEKSNQDSTIAPAPNEPSWAELLKELAHQCIESDPDTRSFLADAAFKQARLKGLFPQEPDTKDLLSTLKVLSGLPLEHQYALVQAWPVQAKMNLHKPSAFFQNKALWAVLKEEGLDRKWLLEKGLTSLVSWGEASHEERFATLKALIWPDKEGKRPQAFQQRLKLWQSLGGDLDAALVIDQEEDWSNPEKQSYKARYWVEANFPEMWLHEFAAPNTRFARPGFKPC